MNPKQLLEHSTVVEYGPVTTHPCSGGKNRFSPIGTSTQLFEGTPYPGCGLHVTQYHSVMLGVDKIIEAYSLSALISSEL